MLRICGQCRDHLQRIGLRNEERVGNVYKTVIDEKTDNGYLGRSYLDSPEIDSAIIISSDCKHEIGDFIDVKITDYDGYDLIGEEI